MSTSRFTLNSLLETASITNPRLLPQDFQEICKGVDPENLERNERSAIKKASRFLRPHFQSMGLDAQILPLLTPPFEGLSIVSGYSEDSMGCWEGKSKYSGRGIYDSQHESMVFFRPLEADRFFFKHLDHEEDGIFAQLFLTVEIPDNKARVFQANFECIVYVSTSFQESIERVLNILVSIVRLKDSSQSFSEERDNLFESLREIGLASMIGEIICLAHGGHNERVTLFDILKLKKEERECVGEVWEEALAGICGIYIPFTTRQRFTAHVNGRAKSLGWNRGLGEDSVPDRCVPEVTSFVSRLGCNLDGGLAQRLVANVVEASGALCRRESTWRDLAQLAVLRGLNREMAQFIV